METKANLIHVVYNLGRIQGKKQQTETLDVFRLNLSTIAAFKKSF